MGNSNVCFRTNRVTTAQDPELYSDNFPATEPIKVQAEDHKPAGRSAMAKPRTAGAKKVVRFKLEEDNRDENNKAGDMGGVLRIKVVVSHKELKQILKDRENNSCSVEQLIAELKVKAKTSTISEAVHEDLQ